MWDGPTGELTYSGLRVLELGCGTGALLAALEPSHGVGVDFSPAMVAIARAHHPQLSFVVADVENSSDMAAIDGTFDVIIMSDTIGSLEDCQATLESLHRFCAPHTRLIIAYYSKLWEPILRAGELARLKMPAVQQNWLFTDDIANLLDLAQFQVVKREWRQLVPRSVLGIGTLINRYIAPWPFIRRACLRNYIVARPVRELPRSTPSATVVIPCRNERGNVEAAVQRRQRRRGR